jgi:transcriptional regulator of acetoin/glycerol metabolism
MSTDHGLMAASEHAGGVGDSTSRGSDEPTLDGGDGALRFEVVHSADASAVGRVVVLSEKDELLVGREVAEGLRIADTRLSRVHLRIRRDSPSTYRLEDAESANGTFVNGRPVRDRALCADDVVRAGDTVFVCFETDLAADLKLLQHRVARSKLAVLIQGETGTGKELLARGIHELSGRSGPFIAVNCAALPSDLAATELFGHTRGAFSGAGAARSGLFRAAERGTLLLDEIGDLPADLQGYLLRTLQEGSIRPVGADREVPVDVRVLAATHVDLTEAVRQERFRADLLSRLTQLTVRIPPLRARRTEILRLVREFAPELELTASAAEALLVWNWPSNVRELRALVEAHVAVNPKGVPLRAKDLVGRLPSAEQVLKREANPEPADDGEADLRDRLTAALARHHGNVSEVARELGEPRTKIYRWLEALGLTQRDFRGKKKFR